MAIDHSAETSYGTRDSVRGRAGSESHRRSSGHDRTVGVAGDQGAAARTGLPANGQSDRKVDRSLPDAPIIGIIPRDPSPPPLEEVGDCEARLELIRTRCELLLVDLAAVAVRVEEVHERLHRPAEPAEWTWEDAYRVACFGHA